jgi:uncharacterized protein (TIGR00251 family)
MMSINDAVKEGDDGVLIDIEVTPGTKTVKVPSGYNPWRKRIEVRLSREAQKGKANQQLIHELSGMLGIKEHNVTLISGHTGHKKTIHIRGMNLEQVLNLMESLIDKV